MRGVGVVSRIVSATICAGIVLAQPSQIEGPSRAMAVPALPYIDHGACPYEHCAYQEWTVRRTVTVYDTWQPGRKAIAQLSPGDKATGITGMVITYKPGVIRMERDLPERNLRLGGTILTYSNVGGGYSAVWFAGRYYLDFDVTFAKLPNGQGCGNGHCAASYVDLGKQSWWAQVRFASGRTGWVDMEIDKMPVALY
jgi:hypothetical protein